MKKRRKDQNENNKNSSRPVFVSGVMTAQVHMAWSKLEYEEAGSALVYSPSLYCRLPMSEPLDAQADMLEQATQAIMNARLMHPDCSLSVYFNDIKPEIKEPYPEESEPPIKVFK